MHKGSAQLVHIGGNIKGRSVSTRDVCSGMDEANFMFLLS